VDTNTSPEANEAVAVAEQPSAAPLLVKQPDRMKSLMDHIDSFVSENVREDISGDLGGGGGGTGDGDDDDNQQPSAREIALKSLPTPQVMQERIANHIEYEVKNLRKDLRKVDRLRKKGAAYKLTKLYARLRLLNSLLKSVLDASGEVVQRIFVRVFIDKQPIIEK
jgi:hypothetical protein